LSYARAAARPPRVAYRFSATGVAFGMATGADRPAAAQPRRSRHGRLRLADGMWRSLVSAPALGAGGPRFESGHPDHKCSSRACRRLAGWLSRSSDRHLTVNLNTNWRHSSARAGSCQPAGQTCGRRFALNKIEVGSSSSSSGGRRGQACRIRALGSEAPVQKSRGRGC
jgi:hypothetical protein